MTLNWGLPFYLLAIYGLVKYFAKPTQEPTNKAQKRWRGWEAIAVLLAIYFTTQFLAALIALIYPTLKSLNLNQAFLWIQDTVNGQFLFILAFETLSVAALFLYLKRQQISLKSIGIRKPVWNDLSYVFIGFLAYFLLYVGVTSVLKALIPSLNVDQTQQLGFKNTHGWELSLVFVSLALLPPLAEELLMRGYLYGRLKKYWQPLIAILATSTLFALAHLQAGSGAPLLWIAAIDTFILSLVLIYVREKTGGLWSSIGLHMAKNIIAFLALFVFR